MANECKTTQTKTMLKQESAQNTQKQTAKTNIKTQHAQTKTDYVEARECTMLVEKQKKTTPSIWEAVCVFFSVFVCVICPHLTLGAYARQTGP